MKNIFIVMPVSCDHIRQRYLSFHLTFHDLMDSIYFAKNYIYSYKLLILVNGPIQSQDDIFLFKKSLLSLDSKIEVRIVAQKSKILAINEALEICRQQQWDLFFSLDNDIRLPLNLLNKMIELALVKKFDAIVCEKASIQSEKSTEFQIKYGRFVNLALQFRIFPNRRPTGSFYCLNPKTIFEFPLDSSEGDYLGSFTRAFHTNDFIYSEYPETIEAEILRRQKRAQEIDRTHKNIKRNIQDINYINWIEEHSPFPAHIQDDMQFKESFQIFKNVIDKL